MSVSLPRELMVGVSGFRGRVGSCLTPELVTSISAAFGAFLRAEGSDGPVYLGRDSRTSGRMLSDAARAGLVSVGTDVVEVGLAPTPTILLAARDTSASGAVAVTASHNPAEWNALKLAGPRGRFLDAGEMARFRRFLAGTPARRAGWDGLGSVREDLGAIERHIGRILELPYLDVERLRTRQFRVALDCVRGAGGVIMPELLAELGCVVSGMETEPDGRFPRDPEPAAANLGGLGRLVRESGSDLGLAVDPDVDRLSLVDSHGEPLGEDLTLALCVALILGRQRGPVVANLSTSRVVEDVAGALGGRMIRAPVGEINVSRRMEQAGAVVGGEGNGGVILPELHLTRDGVLASALLLEHLAEADTGLAEAAARWPAYAIVKEKLAFPRDRIGAGYRALASGLSGGEEDTTDGLRVDWPVRGEWIHVRPSGTEPVVRVIGEARSGARARALVARAGAILAAAGG